VNVPDPANPTVRDAFFTHLGERATIATVGKAWVLAHYSNGVESPSSRSVVATWTPAPPPLIEQDLTLYVSEFGHVCSNEVLVGADIHVRSFTVHPNGTWTEVAA
jgi:hypothetical protein